MTVKYYTDEAGTKKIVLKDGKVSCSCCEEPECCMYPAGKLQNGDYPETDLPDSVLFYGNSISRNGTSYGNLSNGIFLEEGLWAVYRNSSRSTLDCLITGDGGFTLGDDKIEDEFEDVYLATVAKWDGSPSTGLIYRQSLCRWTGIQDCGQSITLIYFGLIQGGEPPGINTNPLWSIAWGYCPDPAPGRPSDSYFKSSGSNGTPVGSYGPLTNAISIP